MARHELWKCDHFITKYIYLAFMTFLFTLISLLYCLSLSLLSKKTKSIIHKCENKYFDNSVSLRKEKK